MVFLRSLFLCIGAGLLAAAAFGAELVPLKEFQLPAARWSPGKFGKITGDRVVIDVPAGARSALNCADATVDLVPFRGQSLCFTIRARAWNVSTPRDTWNGVKFMLNYRDADGQEYWHHPSRLKGTFDWREVSFTCSISPSAQKGTLKLGLQDSSGKVEFDLASLKVYTLFPLAKKYLDTIEEQAAAIARDFRVKGILNVQFAVCEDQVWIIEANPRASRTVPVVSKVTGMPLARIATYLMLGHSLSEYKDILKPHPQTYFGVKEAVFPFNMFPEVDPVLGPEMRATGEVMGLAPTFGMAYFKAQQAAGSRLPLKGTGLVSGSERERKYLLPIVRTLHELGFKLVATEGTAKFLAENGIPHSEVKKLNEGRPNVADLIKNREVALIINTPIGRLGKIDDSCIRMLAIQYKIPYMTTIAAAKASAAGIREALHGDSSPKSLQEYQSGR